MLKFTFAIFALIATSLSQAQGIDGGRPGYGEWKNPQGPYGYGYPGGGMGTFQRMGMGPSQPRPNFNELTGNIDDPRVTVLPASSMPDMKELNELQNHMIDLSLQRRNVEKQLLEAQKSGDQNAIAKLRSDFEAVRNDIRQTTKNLRETREDIEQESAENWYLVDKEFAADKAPEFSCGKNEKIAYGLSGVFEAFGCLNERGQLTKSADISSGTTLSEAVYKRNSSGRIEKIESKAGETGRTITLKKASSTFAGESIVETTRGGEKLSRCENYHSPRTTGGGTTKKKSPARAPRNNRKNLKSPRFF
jgi:hypothetical protein